jgi:hypothetical protein
MVWKIFARFFGRKKFREIFLGAGLSTMALSEQSHARRVRTKHYSGAQGPDADGTVDMAAVQVFIFPLETGTSLMLLNSV